MLKCCQKLCVFNSHPQYLKGIPLQMHSKSLTESKLSVKHPQSYHLNFNTFCLNLFLCLKMYFFKNKTHCTSKRFIRIYMWQSLFVFVSCWETVFNWKFSTNTPQVDSIIQVIQKKQNLKSSYKILKVP